MNTRCSFVTRIENKLTPRPNRNDIHCTPDEKTSKKHIALLSGRPSYTRDKILPPIYEHLCTFWYARGVHYVYVPFPQSPWKHTSEMLLDIHKDVEPLEMVN